MYSIIKSEEELFSDIESFSPLSIVIQQALLCLARIRSKLIAFENGTLEDLSGLCRDFEDLVSAFKAMRDQIGACDPYHFPALVFLEFSQALHFVLRRVRRFLPQQFGEDPITGVSEKLDEIKDWCRPEKRPDNITAETFQKGIGSGFEGLVNHACKIALVIRSYASERGVSRPPTPTEATLLRLEMTAEDTNETVRRFDNRDRRHRNEAGTGGQLGLSAQKKCSDLWQECCRHPEWFGNGAKGTRVTKRLGYDYLVRHRLLPSIVDCFKTFVRAIDSARKQVGVG